MTVSNLRSISLSTLMWPLCRISPRPTWLGLPLPDLSLRDGRLSFNPAPLITSDTRAFSLWRCVVGLAQPNDLARGLR